MLNHTRIVSCNAFGKKAMRCHSKNVFSKSNADKRTPMRNTTMIDTLNNMNARLNQSRKSMESERIQTITDIVNTIAELSRQEMLLVHTVIEECINITFDTDNVATTNNADNADNTDNADTTNNEKNGIVAPPYSNDSAKRDAGN